MRKAEISRNDCEFEEILEYKSDKSTTLKRKNKKPNITEKNPPWILNEGNKFKNPS